MQEEDTPSEMEESDQTEEALIAAHDEAQPIVVVDDRPPRGGYHR